MDPFAAHRQHMSAMFGSMGSPLAFDPFFNMGETRLAMSPLPGPLQPHRRMLAPGALSPFDMFGMGRIGFGDMFGMMNGMFANMNPLMDNVEHIPSAENCQTFSSSTVLSYSNIGNGAPKVYQSTSQMRSVPGGISETRRSMRDSESGLEQVAIGHHIGERAHIMERSMNRRTGDREQRQDFINLQEAEADAFNEEWQRETSRFGGARGIGYRRGGGATDGRTPALTYTDPSQSPHQVQRYDW